MFRGRQAEKEAVERLLSGARDGRSGVLVVRGEAGIGKSALLEEAHSAATGFRVLRTSGVEAESGFAFAGLHQLCAPILDRLGVLPEPQQIALGVALGQRTGDPPDPFLVGLATLSLLAEAAEEQPLLCLLDDAHWLDSVSVQVLAFVARRLEVDRVAIVVGLRDPLPGEASERPFRGLPELHLEGLRDEYARDLLMSAVRSPLDPGVRDRIVAEARGNPLALRELAQHAEPNGLAGGFGAPDVMSVPERIAETFRRRVSELSSATRLLALIAAADPVGDAALLWRAVEHLGIPVEAAEPAQAAGLFEVDTRVRFVHPLARSAVYRAADPTERRQAHAALAAVTDQDNDPDRRAWHAAQAVLGTDETVAAELERSAVRAQARGGLAAAAAFLERSAALTPDPAARAHRTVTAAHTTYASGAPDAALELLAVAAAGPLNEMDRAQTELLRAQIAYHERRGNDLPGTLLDAATLLAPMDAALSRETHLAALEAAIVAGPLGRGRGAQEVAEAAAEAPPEPSPPRPLDRLLDGLVSHFTRGYEEAVPDLRRAVAEFHNWQPRSDGTDLHWMWLASHTAMSLWDDDAIYALATRYVRLARDLGALTTLPFALTFLSTVLVHTGELERVNEIIAEIDPITEATGAPPMPYARLMLAAWSGDRDQHTVLRGVSDAADAAGRGEGTSITIGDYTQAVLHNGLGNYDDALICAQRVVRSGELVHSSMVLPELVEAALRTERPGLADEALKTLTPLARASGTQWHWDSKRAREHWSPRDRRPMSSTVRRSTGSARAA